ncbi:hypothetical protein GCM10010315_19520 [Streptomyces luteosporeus]|uniref:Uncharacterized protein n=1 Tax=Streptomyces luteosporeus TaxID=173856 RepID=A0ABP6G464_9ACTN
MAPTAAHRREGVEMRADMGNVTPWVVRDLGVLERGPAAGRRGAV